MRLLLCAAEMAPLAKVGGLGDVMAALPRALAARGHEVRVVIPLHASIDRDLHGLHRTGTAYTVPVAGVQEPARVWAACPGGGVHVYLVEHPGYFGGASVYSSSDLERYLFFSRATLELVRHLDWQPDLVHCHDWHTGFVPSLLACEAGREPPYHRVASVFTIHNLGYQGHFDYRWAVDHGLSGHIPPRETPLHPLLWRAAALGIYHADAVSTVSETYAREIQGPEHGQGLDPLLRHRREDLFGIVNGIDYGEADPATDPHLAVRFDLATLERRPGATGALRREVGLPEAPGVPLLAYVGRLAAQKGVPLLVEGVEPLLQGGRAQVVALGQGEAVYEEALRGLAERNPASARAVLHYDEGLARRVYAGCDLFLMPSLYEPCGVGQLMALRYGAVPVVRRTGGLADTVVEHPVTGNGFAFREASDASGLRLALERALALYGRPEAWRRLVARAMACDTSWDRTCHGYEALYAYALRRRGL